MSYFKMQIKMKKYLFTTALFLIFFGTTFAQKMSIEDKPKKATHKMEKDLALNDDQRTKIYLATLEKI